MHKINSIFFIQLIQNYVQNHRKIKLLQIKCRHKHKVCRNHIAATVAGTVDP